MMTRLALLLACCSLPAFAKRVYSHGTLTAVTPGGLDGAGFVTDVDVVAFPPPLTNPGLSMKSWNGTSNGKPYTAHLATIADPRYFR